MALDVAAASLGHAAQHTETLTHQHPALGKGIVAVETCDHFSQQLSQCKKYLVLAVRMKHDGEKILNQQAYLHAVSHLNVVSAEEF